MSLIAIRPRTRNEEKRNKRNRRIAVSRFVKVNKITATPAEQALRHYLNTENTGARWSFQRPIGDRYILDFYCHRAKLAVEVDGGYHKLNGKKCADGNRDSWLFLRGIEVLRFTNERVFADLTGVVATIADKTRERMAAATCP